MEKMYDVVVVGAGSAGLMLSRELGRMKKSVLLVDTKKDLLNLSFHTLGSFLDIEKFGLSSKVIASTVTKMSMYSKNVHHSGTGVAYIIDKKQLHKELLDSLDPQFVDIRTDTTIKEIVYGESNEIKQLEDLDGNKYSAKIFVDTSGPKGILSKKVGLQDKRLRTAVGMEYNVSYSGNPEKTYFFIGRDIDGGYAWLFPLGNKRAILGFCSLNPELFNLIPSRLNKLFDHPKLSKLVTKDNDEIKSGVLPITDIKTKFVYKNLVCVGDSVSQVNPLAGEGYRFILESAFMASSAINKALDRDDLSYLKEYEDNWKEAFYESYKNSKKVQRMLERFTKSNFLTDFGLFFLKTKRNSTLLKLIKGEMSIRDIYLP